MQDNFAVAIADGAPESGFGHLVRTSAVITALRLRGVRIYPLALGATMDLTIDDVRWSPSDIQAARRAVGDAPVVLLDSYRALTDAPELGSPVACFFDPGKPPPDAELVIAPPLDSPGPAGWLCGLRYACLRPSFWGGAAARISPAVNRVLVTTGGTDPDGISDELLDAAKDAVPRAELRRVRASNAPPRRRDVVELDAMADLRPELRAADLVVCLGGQTALEAACVGVPTVAVAAVPNQEANVRRLAELGAVEGLRRDDPIASRIAALASDLDRRKERSAAGQAAVDGFGALRVAARLESAFERRLARGSAGPGER